MIQNKDQHEAISESIKKELKAKGIVLVVYEDNGASLTVNMDKSIPPHLVADTLAQLSRALGTLNEDELTEPCDCENCQQSKNIH